MDDFGWALLGIDKLVTFMSGAGFVWDLQKAARSGNSNLMGEVNTLVG